MTNNVVLLGDSTFDNAAFVPGQESLVQQLREALGDEWTVTLLAGEGRLTSDVAGRIDELPDDATHVIVSVGGNDAMQGINIREERHDTVVAALSELAGIPTGFRANYRDMLEQIVAYKRATVVCTIYDQIPLPTLSLRRLLIAGLSVFNDSIIREAIRFKLPVLDLRNVCVDSADFSGLSPFEPSCEGGSKIAHAIARLLQDHDFATPRTVIYP